MKRSLNDELAKLYSHNHKLEIKSKTQLLVYIPGPKDSFYKDGTFTILITLSPEYPFKSPSIGFKTKIFHPNVDEQSGSICLDVLNQVWSPLFDLLNVVEVFIPQLLTYPNPLDPLNAAAAELYLNDKKAFQNQVNVYIKMNQCAELDNCTKNYSDDSDLSI
ncbi:Ubiquitin-conjugating enzyme E2-23 kDa [Dictyocoela muelleri]|nr:Ubiquitin-conjugating enzyme E2-23 kDa [Dictyocoela muelleri]